MDIEIKFLYAKAFHGCSKKNLEHILNLTTKSKFTTNEVKLEIERRIKWVLGVRKLWRLVVKFFKLDK